MYGFSITKFCIAIVVGIILSFFFVAMTVPQTVEQPVVEITPVSTPEPVYVEETSEPDVNAQEENPMTSPVSELMGDLILCTTLIFVALFILIIILS
jgi:hypothetical protein